MDVFLIPVGRSRYELYYEAPEEAAVGMPDEPDGSKASGGLFRRWRQRFNDMLREAEQQRHDKATGDPPGFLQRVQRRLLGLVAERIAERRLLWHMRNTDRVTAHVPSDMSEDEALQVIRKMLKSDGDRHLRWLIVDLLLLAASAPLMFVPGPNVLAYYFTFNVVGHFLAMMGARRGLSGITWTMSPSAPLADLRAALSLAEPQRYRRVLDVANRLRLQHLTRFFERIALPT
jgi:hypothetical protein